MQKRARHEPRFPVALVATLLSSGTSVDCVTHDVSFEGVSVETSAPGEDDAPSARGEGRRRPAALSLGQLVRLRVSLPGAPAPLDVAAVVVHTMRGKNRSGAGLRFYAMGRDAQATWDRFIGRLRDEFPAMTGRGVLLPRAEHFEPKLYRSAHQVACLRVYVRSVAELYALVEPDVETMFALTDERVRVGDELGLQLVHPDSEDIFEVSAFVVRIVDEVGVRGLELEFLDLDAERRARLREFIDDGLEALFDEETLVEDEGPGGAPRVDADAEASAGREGDVVGRERAEPESA